MAMRSEMGKEKVQRVLLEFRRHGGLNTLHGLTLRAVNAVTLVKILRGISVERPDPRFLEIPERYSGQFVGEAILRGYAGAREYEMTETFLDEALARGDECLAIREGDDLAAYGWYSFAPTPIDPPDLRLHFSDRYVYMYKGYTHPRHRGQRLHAIGMTMALRHYLSKGYLGLVSYVESTNFDSLKSVFRMGYRQFGSVYVTRVFGRCVARSSRGCARFGFRVEPGGAPIGPSKVQLAS